MIVIRPAQSQFILSRLLNLRRAIAGHPIFPLTGEKQVACQIAAKIGDCIVDQIMHVRKALGFIVKIPLAAMARTFDAPVDAIHT